MCRQILAELSNIEFHENPLSGFRVVTNAEDRQADMMKQAHFLNFR
jgi:hypothetical protein